MENWTTEISIDLLVHNVEKTVATLNSLSMQSSILVSNNYP